MYGTVTCKPCGAGAWSHGGNRRRQQNYNGVCNIFFKHTYISGTGEWKPSNHSSIRTEWISNPTSGPEEARLHTVIPFCENPIQYQWEKSHIYGAECLGKRHNTSCKLSAFLFWKWNGELFLPLYQKLLFDPSVFRIEIRPRQKQIWGPSESMAEQGIRHWTLQLSGIADGLRSTFRRNPRHAARCTRLATSLYLGRRSRSSFSALCQVQELVRFSLLNLTPRSSQMQRSPSLQWIENIIGSVPKRGRKTNNLISRKLVSWRL